MIIDKEYDIEKRWESKRDSIYNLRDTIERLKRKVRSDLYSSDDKTRLTALVVRIMMLTSERVGNSESASNGHFGVTGFKRQHVDVEGNKVILTYKGKSGVEHEKSFSDAASAMMIRDLIKRAKSPNAALFATADGFEIKADKVNRYLRRFDAKSKDIRGFNANRLMVVELKSRGKIKDEKDRKKVFNEALRKVSSKIGHGPATLRKQYLLPEIEEQFYKHGSIGRIKID
jgi:DNA topoisomerase-1